MAKYYYFISSVPQPEWGMSYAIERHILKEKIWNTLTWEDQEFFRALTLSSDIQNLVEYHKSIRFEWYKATFDQSGNLEKDFIKTLPDGAEALDPMFYDFFSKQDKSWETLTSTEVEESLYQRFYEYINSSSLGFLHDYFSYKTSLDTIQYFLLSQQGNPLEKTDATEESLWMKLSRYGDFKGQLNTEYPFIENWKTFLAEGNFKKLFYNHQKLIWQWLDDHLLGHEFDIQGIIILYLKASIALEMQELQSDKSQKALDNVLETAHLSTQKIKNHDHR